MFHLELNRSIYNILINDNLIKKYDVGVYFNIPNKARFPYIYIGLANLFNISTKSNQYFKIINHIEIYTKNNGNNIHMIIIDQIIKILNKSNLKLKNLVNMNLVGYEINLKEDGTIIHLSSKFKSNIEVI